jgi:predicted nucleotidyltransferase
VKRAVGQDDVRFSFNALRPLWREFGVERAWLFGGRARGEAGADSDWDFLVEFAGRPGFSNFMGLKCALEDALGTKVDVLSRSAVKPRFLAMIEKELVDVCGA